MKAQTSGGTVCAPLLIYIPPPPSVTWIPDAELVPQLYRVSGPVSVLFSVSFSGDLCLD